VGAPIVPDPGGPDDFAGFAAGSIALIQRGGCSFGEGAGLRSPALRLCERPAKAVCFGIIDHQPDYELEDVLVVDEPTKLRALADSTRGRIIALLNQRAASTTELATALMMPKGTVGHHLKVLEHAGLIRVVRTRQVRALTEKYYGRVARLFQLKSVGTEPDLGGGALAAMLLRHAADEALATGADEAGEVSVRRVRLTEKDVRRFKRRLLRLFGDFEAADDPDGELHLLTFAFFRSASMLPPGGDGDA
jgi:DNA-binding transcriptional ArsR family regulator